MKNELIIPFESFLHRGVQRELIDSGNESNFLNKTYTQAFTLIKMICEKSKYIIRFSDAKANQYEIHNVIAFTGRRGTGKTSAMLSIADSLSDMSYDQENEFNMSDAFIPLPYINAAVLDETEDIFLITLSKLFRFLDSKLNIRDIPYDNKRIYDDARTIKEDICKIFDHYVHLKGNEQFTSSYNSMEKLSDRYSIREEFAELIQNYTNIIKKLFYVNSKSEDVNLVICIDDIDMSRQDHMHIMQCIHQYFMIPRIIVMVTLNFPMLTASLQKDSYSKFVESKENLHQSFEHTNDFLRKVIPSDMRITMPSWRKYDYRMLTPVRIDFGNSRQVDTLKTKFPSLKDSILLKKLAEHKNENYTLGPKELVLMMLADRTNIYLDAKGNKIHFMEPDSLRNLYDIFYMLYHMSSIVSRENNKTEDDTFFQDRNANRKILLDYLYFKLLPEYDFSSDEKQFITELLAEPIDRRGKRIWDYYFKCLTADRQKKRIESYYGIDYFVEEKHRYKIENYSFGELFRILHSGSRTSLIERKLIKFILASFSFSLPQFIENEKWKNSKKNPNYSITKNEYINIRNIFGYTLLGTWCRDLFAGHQINTVIYINRINDLCNNKGNSKRSKTININNEGFQSLIEDLLLLLLLTSRSTRNNYAVVYNETGYYSIDNNIDPTSFIINSLRMEQRFERMKFTFKGKNYESDLRVNDDGISEVDVYAISKLLSAIFKDLGYSITAKKFDILIKKQLNFWKSNVSGFFDTTNHCNNTLWFFLKHTDISYNVIKRAISYMIYISDNNLKEKKPNLRTPFQTIQKFYEIIYDKLQQQDKVYFDESYQKTYSSEFISHPIVSRFINKSNMKLSYNEFKSNGCGMEFGKLDINLKKYPDFTLGGVLSSINTKSSTQIMDLTLDILGQNLHTEQISNIIDIIYFMDNLNLSMRDGYNMILLTINNKIQEVQDALDAFENQWMYETTGQEDNNNDSTQ